LLLDTRQGVCYAAVHQRMCELTSTTGLMFTKAECCCNRGKGWSEDCEECPHPGTGKNLLLIHFLNIVYKKEYLLYGFPFVYCMF